MTSGSDFTWKAERKSASRTARAATCWAMRRPAVNGGGGDGLSVGGIDSGEAHRAPAAPWVWNERIY